MFRNPINRRQFTGLSAAILAGALLPLGRSAIAAASYAPGFYVPEEREPHERTFMQWPVSRQVHPEPEFRGHLQKTIADIANTIVDFEPVVMLMRRKYALEARRILDHRVEIWDIPTEDLWCRDSGPLFLTNGKGDLAVGHVNFNGWGGKQVHKSDGKIAARIAERMGLPLFDNGIVGEPGGIESDGEGTLIAHESCWVNENRNLISRAEIERKLLETYGAEKMIWAPGLKGYDITDDHIDATARFVEPGHILIQLPESPEDYPPFSTNIYRTYDILSEATDAHGRSFRISTIPDPVNIRQTSEDFLASYVNYYVCNGGVICAEFGDEEADAIAIETLRELYPDREVVSLNVDDLGLTGGGIHCATQQQPAV